MAAEHDVFRCAKTSGPRPGAKCANCSLYFLGIKDGIQEIIASLAGLHVRRQRHYCLHSLRSFGDRLEVDGPGSKDGDSLVEGHVAAVGGRQIFMRKVSRHYPHSPSRALSVAMLPGPSNPQRPAGWQPWLAQEGSRILGPEACHLGALAGPQHAGVRQHGVAWPTNS